MTKNKQLTEYLKEVLNLANDNLEVSVYDEDNNADDLSNGIVSVRVENLELDEFLIRQISYISND